MTRTVYPSEVTVPAPVDLSAMGLSILCLLHCLALPVLASVMPVLGAWSEVEWVHKLFVLLAIPVTSYAAFVRGVRYRDGVFIFLVVTGLIMLVGAAFFGYFHAFEKPMTVIGGIFVAGGHFWRFVRHVELPRSSEESS